MNQHRINYDYKWNNRDIKLFCLVSQLGEHESRLFREYVLDMARDLNYTFHIVDSRMM